MKEGTVGCVKCIIRITRCTFPCLSRGNHACLVSIRIEHLSNSFLAHSYYEEKRADLQDMYLAQIVTPIRPFCSFGAKERKSAAKHAWDCIKWVRSCTEWGSGNALKDFPMATFKASVRWGTYYVRLCTMYTLAPKGVQGSEKRRTRSIVCRAHMLPVPRNLCR